MDIRKDSSFENQETIASLTLESACPADILGDQKELSICSDVPHFVLSPQRRHSLSDLLSFSEQAVIPSLKKSCRSFDCLAETNLMSGFGIDLSCVGSATISGPSNALQNQSASNFSNTESVISTKSDVQRPLEAQEATSTAAAAITVTAISRSVSVQDIPENISAITIKARRKSSPVPSRSSTVSSLTDYNPDEAMGNAFTVSSINGLNPLTSKSERITLYLTRRYSTQQSCSSEPETTSDASRLELTALNPQPQENSVVTAFSELRSRSSLDEPGTSCADAVSGTASRTLVSILSTDSIPSIALSDNKHSSAAIEELYLENEWSFWLDSIFNFNSGNRLSADKDSNSELVDLGSVNTVQGFWLFWNNLTIESWNPDRRLCLFKKGIKPIEEDSCNTGRCMWIMDDLLKRHRAKIWSTMALLLIGEQLEFDDPDNMVCGVVFFAGPASSEGGDSVQLWMDGSHGGRSRDDKTANANISPRESSMRQIVEQYFHEEINLNSLKFTKHNQKTISIGIGQPSMAISINPQLSDNQLADSSSQYTSTGNQSGHSSNFQHVHPVLSSNDNVPMENNALLAKFLGTQFSSQPQLQSFSHAVNAALRQPSWPDKTESYVSGGATVQPMSTGGVINMHMRAYPFQQQTQPLPMSAAALQNSLQAIQAQFPYVREDYYSGSEGWCPPSTDTSSWMQNGQLNYFQAPGSVPTNSTTVPLERATGYGLHSGSFYGSNLESNLPNAETLWGDGIVKSQDSTEYLTTSQAQPARRSGKQAVHGLVSHSTEERWQAVELEKRILLHKLEQINYLLDIYERVRSAPVDSTFVVSDILTTSTPSLFTPNTAVNPAKQDSSVAMEVASPFSAGDDTCYTGLYSSSNNIGFDTNSQSQPPLQMPQYMQYQQQQMRGIRSVQAFKSWNKKRK